MSVQSNLPIYFALEKRITHGEELEVGQIESQVHNRKENPYMAEGVPVITTSVSPSP